MKQTIQASSRHQRLRMSGGSCLLLLAGILALGRATATEAADLEWQPPACRADVARSGANAAMSGAPIFIDAVQARRVLTTAGTGRLEITSLQGKRLTVHVFRPSQFDSRTGRIWFVMHGTGRNAEHYLQKAAPVAERYQVLALAVEFSREDYPDGDAYTLGVVNRGRANENAADEGRWRSLMQTPYFEIERAFSAVSEVLQSRQPGYFLFGHSAGAQFVHRLLSFLPCPRVLGAVAANAGWYTLPTIDETQPPFPYSLRRAAREVQNPRQILAAPLTILLGARDTRGNDEDYNLRASAGAMAQGSNRLERGWTYYEAGKQAARSAHMPFAWKIQLVPGAGHDVTEVITSAGQLLFSPSSASTYDLTSSPRTNAAQIVFQEERAALPKPRGRQPAIFSRGRQADALSW